MPLARLLFALIWSLILSNLSGHIYALDKISSLTDNHVITGNNGTLYLSNNFSISKISPNDGQLDVKLNKKVLVTFNGALDNEILRAANIHDHFKVIKGYYKNDNLTNLVGDTIKGKYSLKNNNHTLVFSPHSDLLPNTVYTVILSGNNQCQNRSSETTNNRTANESANFFIPSINVSVSKTTVNSTENNCGYRDAIWNRIWSFKTMFSPPTISEPHDNFTTNSKMLMVSGHDPNHSELIKLFGILKDAESKSKSKSKNDKLTVLGYSLPSKSGDWSIKAHLDKLQDGKWQLFASTFDSFDNKSSDSKTLTLIIDRSPPIVNVPFPINDETTNSGGAPVKFQFNATDLVDGLVKTKCSPLSSGDIFPIGITKVKCSAIDEAGNKGSASVFVNVTSITDPIGLSCKPANLVVPAGGESSLNCFLENKLSRSVVISLTCSQLEQFGFQCYINGNLERATTNLKGRTSESFKVVFSNKLNQTIAPGTHAFTVSANCITLAC